MLKAVGYDRSKTNLKFRMWHLWILSD